MKLFNKISISALSVVILLALTPGTAMAKGSIHIDIPGLSIGVHDGYRGKHKHRKHKRYYRDNYYYEDHYRSNRYDRRRDRRERKRDYYYNNRYDNNYYYGSRKSKRYYNYSEPRRVQRCPNAGYSRYYLKNRGCSSHNDHFHC